MAADQSKASSSGQKMPEQKYKIFNDSVHGHIEMHPLLVEIIDTPEFQRLRRIKQLGAGYYVFPGASHNRFEHSIGVAHLAGELVRSLRAKESETTDKNESKITDKDELCVQIAGLCHDLGHGPFSHVFEVFMKEANEKLEWKHEKASVKMFEQLITKNISKNNKTYTIKQFMENEYEFEDKDFEFIKELIDNPYSEETEEWQHKGRTVDKSYLYEIVANKLTGIDVDKMDYFSRDCLHLGMKSSFSHERYVKFARVCTDDKNKKHICMRDKEALNMYELFHVRYLLHHKAYQHRVTKAIERMIIDALLAAELDFFTVDGKKISVAVTDMSMYLKLIDNILEDIKQRSSNAKQIIERIERRELYRFVGGKIFKPEDPKNFLKTADQKTKLLQEWLNQLKSKKSLTPKDFRITVIHIDYGKKDKNPIDSLQFYRKRDVHKAVKLSKDEVSYIKPEIFQETKVLLFYTETPDPGLDEKQIDKFWEIIKEKSKQEQASHSKKAKHQ